MREEEIEKLFDAKNVGGIPSKKVKCRENAKKLHIPYRI
jgi:hypothetical protein